MFAFPCPTCEAKLVVKDEKLIGKILACPNCGGMVLVQPPESAHTPTPKPVVHKRFPNVLTHETASGVIGPVPEELRRSAILLDAAPKTKVSSTEVTTRKILVGILIGLLASLLIVLGVLMFPRKSVPPQPPPDEPAVQVPVVPPPVEPKVDEPIEIVEPPVIDTPPQESITEPVTIPVEQTHTEITDTLTALNDRMSGFVDDVIPNIDILAKLSLPILELNFDGQSLIGFVRTMSRLTEVPMTLHIDEMKPRNLSVKTPVSGRFSETTAETVLTETLATLNLQWIIAERQILILPKATDDAVDLTFDVSDFAEKTDDLKPDVLAEMIRKLVCPENAVTVLPDNRLAVTPSEANKKSSLRQRDEVLRFLEQLRILRQLPPMTDWAGETLAPEVFGWNQVMEPITLNYYSEVLLSRGITQLESLTKLTIVVDHQSLHRALSPFAQMSATVRCDLGTVNNALELLLASVDSAPLTYRIVDHETLEISTAESLRQPDKMVMEVHRYQLQEEETPEDIVRLLRLTVAPESWAAAELPATQFGGDIVIDEPSSCLLIWQSQPAHRQIRLSLLEPEPLEP